MGVVLLVLAVSVDPQPLATTASELSSKMARRGGLGMAKSIQNPAFPHAAAANATLSPTLPTNLVEYELAQSGSQGDIVVFY